MPRWRWRGARRRMWARTGSARWPRARCARPSQPPIRRCRRHSCRRRSCRRRSCRRRSRRGHSCRGHSCRRHACRTHGDAANFAGEGPLYRPHGEPVAAAAASDQAAQRDCQSDCGPLAWLAGLFEGFAGEDSVDEETAATSQDAASEEHSDPSDAGREPAAPAGAPEAPPGSASIASRPGHEDAAGEDFREPEEIARIWIAPFVDAEGIYHEGAWVRAVIAPAAWRLR